MLRSLLSVIAGILAWTALWLGTNGMLAGPFPEYWGEGARIEQPLVLLLIIGYSVVFSVLAGWLTARLAGRAEARHALALGLVQVALGLAVTVAFYDTAPLWYHVVFVALLMPGNVLGARLRLAQKRAAHPSTL
jgi:hypothetical protein